MVLSFSGDLTIRTAEQTRGKLAEELSSGVDKIVIALEEVDQVDLSFIQLIVSARKSATSSGRAMVMAGPADGILLETLRRGGFVADGENTDNFWLESAP